MSVKSYTYLSNKILEFEYLDFDKTEAFKKLYLIFFCY